MRDKIKFLFLPSILVLTSFTKPALSLCPWQEANLLPWSSASTWPDEVPVNGSRVTVKHPVLLDTSTPQLVRLDILDGGRLVFSPNATVFLTADTVRVGPGGSLAVGSEECPYPAQVVVFQKVNFLSLHHLQFSLDQDFSFNLYYFKSSEMIYSVYIIHTDCSYQCVLAYLHHSELY